MDDERTGSDNPAIVTSHCCCPEGSEWTFELLQRYDSEIARIAAGYGLDTYPNQIEVIIGTDDRRLLRRWACRSATTTGASASSSWRRRKAIDAARWAWPTRSSSTPAHASPT